MNIILAISAGAIWGKIWPVVFAIVFFGIIISLHEFGHFITAKLFGVTVNEFSIGMGPVLLKKKKNGTQYSWRLLPIGGFVSLEGEDEESEDPHAFGNQKAWKRFIVIAAGATINIILGLLLICVMLGADGKVASKEVYAVSDYMAAEENGIRVGDKIESINGISVFSARDLYYGLYRDNDGIYDITLKRDGEKIKLEAIEVRYSAEEGYCDFIVGEKDVKFYNLLPGAVTETASMTKLVFLSLADMLKGNYGMKDISGAVGTINIVADTASDALTSADYSSLIFILAFITVNIGIVNLLPLPALDGGRLFFLLIEMIFRKPVPKKFEAVVHAVGFALLMVLMAVITFNDIVNIAKG